jgi:excinuclease ABC subunit B
MGATAADKGKSKLEKKKAAKKLTASEREKLIEQYTREMKEASRRLEFEKAAYLRDEIKKLRES